MMVRLPVPADAPKPGNPAIWGFWASVGATVLHVFSSLCLPVGQQTMKAGAEVLAFGWGFILCIIVDNVRYWAWKRVNRRRS